MLRKTRLHQAADDACQELIDLVRAKMPKQAEPKIAAPAVASASSTAAALARAAEG